MLAYSPYTGLIFACHKQSEGDVLSWLEGITQYAPSNEHLKALGPGWAIELESAEYPDRNLLPSDGNQWSSVYADHPIVINWLITGRCSLNCPYCYATDLMDNNYPEPDEARIRTTIKRILSFNPLLSRA